MFFNKIVTLYQFLKVVIYYYFQIFLTCLASSSQAFQFFGQDGLIHKAAQKIGISNLITVEGDARAKFGQNEVDVDGAFGIGESGVGAHGSANADVLGQRARIRADILDGHKIDQHNHQVYIDNQNRQYILQREYIGSDYFLVRKYLNDGQVYLAKSNNANTVQQQQEGDTQQYNQYSENYQLRNYNHRPGSIHQQSGNLYQQFGQDDQPSGQYDHQPGQHNQQSRHYNEEGYGLYSGREQHSGQNQHNQEVFQDDQNRQYIFQKKLVDNKLVQVRQYLDNEHKNVVRDNLDNGEFPRQQSEYNNHNSTTASTAGSGFQANRVVEALDKNVKKYHHDFESGIQSVVDKVKDATGYKSNLEDPHHTKYGQGNYAHQLDSDDDTPISTTNGFSKIHNAVETINKNFENYRPNFESGIHTVVDKIGDVTGYKPNSGEQQHKTQGNVNYESHSGRYHGNHREPTGESIHNLSFLQDTDSIYQAASSRSKISGQNLQVDDLIESDGNLSLLHDPSKVEPKVNGDNSVHDSYEQTTEYIVKSTSPSLEYYHIETGDSTEKADNVPKVSENFLFLDNGYKKEPINLINTEKSQKQKLENETKTAEQ